MPVYNNDRPVVLYFFHRFLFLYLHALNGHEFQFRLFLFNT